MLLKSYTSLPLQTSNSTVKYLPKKNENTYNHKDLDVNVLSAMIHNSLKLKTIQMSIQVLSLMVFPDAIIVSNIKRHSACWTRGVLF